MVQAHKVSTNTDTAVLLTPTTAATDTVTITAATYLTRRQTLQVFVTSTDTLIGSLTKKAKGYKGTFILSSNPGSITVKSSLGGSATAVVMAK